MKRFQRRRENFHCEQCGHAIRGNGYTNHCPQCLWSKHVDINPGDRAHPCRGLMKPAVLGLKRGRFTILHRCTRCGTAKSNKASAGDSAAALRQLAAGATVRLQTALYL